MSDDATFPGEAVTSYDVTGRLGSDYYEVFSDIPAADRAHWERAQAYVDEVGPLMLEAWDRAEYPLAVARRMGEMDLVVDGIAHPALTRMTPLAAGLVNMEISRGDGSLGTVLAVQGGLALRTLALFGSPQQQDRWLVPLADGSVLGSFALTEPDHGSDSVSLETVARRDTAADGTGEWVIRGAKKWIGNGASGGITFVWARIDDAGAEEHGAVRCFLVEQDTPGYQGTVITGKVSLRGIHQAHIRLDDVRVPLDAVLPGTKSFKDASTVLYATRSGVAWSALGHATACYEAALSYAQTRTQFGKPLAKFHNTRAARRVASTARDLLGGNGILLENGVMQHLADIEAIHTYEGTESVQALLIGRDITGMSAFV